MCHSFLHKSLLGTHLSCVCVCAYMHMLLTGWPYVSLCAFQLLSETPSQLLWECCGVGVGSQPSSHL